MFTDDCLCIPGCCFICSLPLNINWLVACVVWCIFFFWDIILDHYFRLEQDASFLSSRFCDLRLQGEFVDDGTETHFTLGDHNCCVKAVSSGKRRDGIIHTLLVDGTEVAECTEWAWLRLDESRDPALYLWRWVRARGDLKLIKSGTNWEKQCIAGCSVWGMLAKYILLKAVL